MTPQQKNLTIYQGSTFRQSWDLRLDGEPLDLTGWTARMQIREKLKSETAMHELTTENGGITISIDPEYTRLSLYIPADVTAGFSARSAVYDLELVDVNADVARLMMGSITIDPEVTR